MTRTGFVVLSLGVLLGLPLAYAASPLQLAGLEAIVAPLLIVLAGIVMGIVVMLRARAASLSGLWGFLTMIHTVQALALIATMLADNAAADPLAMMLGSSALWLVVSFTIFLFVVPDWAGPRALDVGLSAVAALAAIIAIAAGYTMHADNPVGAQRVLADVLEALPYIDWIALGVFVTALTGIIAGRMLPEIE